jgi:hypothetical protein
MIAPHSYNQAYYNSKPNSKAGESLVDAWQVLSQLPKFARNGKGYKACCPAHDDDTPSLGLDRTSDGTILVYCRAHCSTVDVLAAVNLSLGDLFPPTAKRHSDGGELAAIYDYRDYDGSLLFQVLRFERWENQEGVRVKIKAFPQRRPDGQGGWIWKLDDTKRVLYRLPELIAADPCEPVYIAEGEKDADRLATLGLISTTSPGGAGKWKPEYSPCLRGRKVIILPHNDDPGRKHADEVGQSLHGESATARILTLPGLTKEHEDLSDWLDKGNTVEYLRELAEIAFREPSPQETAAQDQEAQPMPAMLTGSALLKMVLPPIKWVIPDVLPEGLGVCGGKPKMGKSWLWLGASIAVATGGFVLGTYKVEQGDALYLALEDNPRRLQDRIRKMLAVEGLAVPPVPLDRLSLATEWKRIDQGGLVDIEFWLQDHSEARLVVVDTFARIKPRRRGNGNAYDDDYADMVGLHQLAHKYGVAIVVVTHLRKLGADDPLETINATMGLTGAVDTALVLMRERGRHDAAFYYRGRDVEERELALKWDGDIATWTVMGDAEDYRRSQARQDILKALRSAGRALLPKEVAEMLGKPQGAVRKLMWEMGNAKELTAEGNGRYSLNDG